MLDDAYSRVKRLWLLCISSILILCDFALTGIDDVLLNFRIADNPEVNDEMRVSQH